MAQVVFIRFHFVTTTDWLWCRVVSQAAAEDNTLDPASPEEGPSGDSSSSSETALPAEQHAEVAQSEADVQQAAAVTSEVSRFCVYLHICMLGTKYF